MRSTVGIAVDATMGYGRQIMRGVMHYANLRRRWLMVEEFHGPETDPSAWPACDGIVASASDPGRLAEFRKRCRHVVVCSGAVDPKLVPVVCIDDFAVGRLAASHLVDCRLRQFGFFGDPDSRLSQNRLRGFTDELARGNFNCDCAPIKHVWRRPIRKGWQSHWPALIKWVTSLPKPVGIMALDDMAAHDLAAACVYAGITIPEEVSVIGVNNDDLLCESAWPPLSSVQTDFQRVGYTAAGLLDRLMAGQKPAKGPTILPPLGVACRTSTNLMAVDEPQLAAAVRFIRENACNPCSVSDILKEVPVCRRWLERQFVQKLGRTPHDEISHVRIQNGQRLLLRADLVMAKVAEECGFSTVQSFSRAFRAATGESPGAFRRARRMAERG